MIARLPRLPFPIILFFSAFVIGLLLTGWTLNDGPIVDDNPVMLITQAFTRTNFHVLLQPDVDIYWRPLGKLSFVPWSDLFGFATWPHRLLTLLLHALATALLFSLTDRLFRRKAAYAAAILFLLHPLHAGNLHWLAARYDVLATVLVLAGLLFYTRARMENRAGFIWFSTLFYLGAYLTKEISFIAPLLCLLLEFHLNKTEKKSGLPRRIAGPTLALALVLGIRAAWMGGIGGPELVYRPQLTAYLANLVLYIPRALLLPINNELFSLPTTAMALIALGALLLFAFLFRTQSNRQPVYFALLFIMIAALPVAGFIYLGAGQEAGYMLYLPSAGFAILAGVLLFNNNLRPNISSALLVFLALAYIVAMVGNLVAYRRASHTAANIVAAGTPYLQQTDRFLLIENTPDRIAGIHLYYDYIDQLFMPQLPNREKSIMLIGRNFWRTEAESLDWPSLAAQSNAEQHIRVIAWNGENGFIDRTSITLAAWQIRAVREANEAHLTFSGRLPSMAEIGGDGILWRRGPISLPCRLAADPSTTDALTLSFTLRIFDPYAADEVALDWQDQNGDMHRASFTVIADGRNHRYRVSLAADSRWARTETIQGIWLHLPFVGGTIKFTE